MSESEGMMLRLGREASDCDLQHPDLTVTSPVLIPFGVLGPRLLSTPTGSTRTGPLITCTAGLIGQLRMRDDGMWMKTCRLSIREGDQ